MLGGAPFGSIPFGGSEASQSATVSVIGAEVAIETGAATITGAGAEPVEPVSSVGGFIFQPIRKAAFIRIQGVEVLVLTGVAEASGGAGITASGAQVAIETSGAMQRAVRNPSEQELAAMVSAMRRQRKPRMPRWM